MTHRSSRRTRTLVPLSLLAALALAAGCGATRVATERETQPDEVGGTRKRVAGKRAPDTLYAMDRSECQVPLDLFARVRVGASFTCIWH